MADVRSSISFSFFAEAHARTFAAAASCTPRTARHQLSSSLRASLFQPQQLAAASASVGVRLAFVHQILQGLAGGPDVGDAELRERVVNNFGRQATRTSRLGLGSSHSSSSRRGAGRGVTEPLFVPAHRVLVLSPVEALGAGHVVEVLPEDVVAELVVVLGAQDVRVPRLVDERAASRGVVR